MHNAFTARRPFSTYRHGTVTDNMSSPAAASSLSFQPTVIQRPLRLAFCNANRKWGGVKTWTLEFADALQKRGHAITIYGRPGAFIERARQMQLNAVPFTFGPDYNPLAIARFYRAFKKHALDAVLVNVGHDVRTAGIAARLAGIPVVQRIGLPRDLKNETRVHLLHTFLQPHYLFPCQYNRDGFLAHLPFVQHDNTTILHTAKTPIAAAPQHVNAPLRFVSTSQINPNKGHAELAHTLAALQQKGYDFQWDIVGEGTALSALKELCTTLGLSKKTTFHGFSQNVSALLQQADVFVLSSYTEGLPNTLLEAMAHGLVPVARSVGGVHECWPQTMPSFLIPHTEHDWTTCAPHELPLYAPLKTILTAFPRNNQGMEAPVMDALQQTFFSFRTGRKTGKLFPVCSY